MDTKLLRSWLNLPPGAWPPPDRELLGLPPGPVNPAEAERRVLERMARLRPHQLLHPDLVTEGMNRVAQALLAVTAGAAVLRLPGLSRPVDFVFDEIWYARNACRYVIGTPECGIDQLASRAHPPLGNWMIGAGIKLFGYDEFGWRISAAVIGTLTVALLFLLTWQLLRRTLALSAMGVTAGLAGAIGAGQLLGGLLINTSPLDSLTFAIVIGLLCTLVLTACLVPASRAMRLDPVAALRHE